MRTWYAHTMLTGTEPAWQSLALEEAAMSKSGVTSGVEAVCGMASLLTGTVPAWQTGL